MTRPHSTERALVTGCAGFLGSHLCERLVDDGVEVVGVDCFTDFYPRLVKERNLGRLVEEPLFELREMDLSVEPVEGLLDGVSTVYHLAAQPGVRGSFGATFSYYVRHNIQATQRLLEEAVRNPVGAFVYASSSSVYGDNTSFPTSETSDLQPVSPYGMTKVATEEIAAVYHRNNGLPVVGLRYFTAYGPRQRPDMALSRFISRALSDQPLPIIGDGRQVRDFTYVDDIIDGTVAASRGRSGSVYNIGGGNATELGELIQILGELLEQPLRIDRRPAQLGDARRTCADGSRAAAEIDFTPATTAIASTAGAR